MFDDLEDVREQGFFKPIKPKNMRFARLSFKGGGSAEIKDTADQKALADIARQRFDRYQQIYVPAENQYISDVMSYDNAGRMAQASGAGNANVQGAFTNAFGDVKRQMTASGQNVASGGFNAAISNYGQDSMYAAADNINRSQQAVQDAKVTGMQNVVAMGQGVAGNAIAGMQDTAGYSAQEAQRRAEESFNRRSALGYVAGTAVGGAVGYQTYGGVG